LYAQRSVHNIRIQEGHLDAAVVHGNLHVCRSPCSRSASTQAGTTSTTSPTCWCCYSRQRGPGPGQQHCPIIMVGQPQHPMDVVCVDDASRASLSGSTYTSCSASSPKRLFLNETYALLRREAVNLTREPARRRTTTAERRSPGQHRVVGIF
jgi:hypothetical protein